MKLNKITILSVLISCFLVASCSNDDDQNDGLICNPTEPFEELDWLLDLRDSIDNCACEVSIRMGQYEGNTVFYKTMTDASCNWQFETDLYNCNGDIIKKYRYSEEQPNVFEKFSEEVTEQENLYSCTVTR